MNMLESRQLWFRLALVTLVLGPIGCGGHNQRRLVAPSRLHTQPPGEMKAHLLSGDVVLFESWKIDETERTITGLAVRQDPNRRVVDEGMLAVSLDDVSLYETNSPTTTGAVTALTVFTVVTGAVAAYCAANPKACFGSCPTFYVFDGSEDLLQAEGFSASFAPSLAATDLDALPRAVATGRDFHVSMRNEAFETHVVRDVEVWAVPKHGHPRVVSVNESRFRPVLREETPRVAMAASGDCRNLLSATDGEEYFSLSNEHDLATKEVVELEFAPLDGELGLVVTSRQSLLSTFLFYQGIAYLGHSYVKWLAELERRGPGGLEELDSILERLGGIDVEVETIAGEWVPVGRARETGPLASDVKLILIPEHVVPTGRVRITMTQGMWRIDSVALAQLGPEVEPVRISPHRATMAGEPRPDALDLLLDPDQSLVAMPGDEFDLTFRLPADYEDHELFLLSEGYYLEWMREHWFEDENPWLAAQMFLDPDAALRRLAPEYKKLEPQMEEIFWSSQYVPRGGS